MTARGPSQSDIAALLRDLGRRAFLAPTTNGFTTIYDAECESQDTDLLGSVALTVSSHFQCPALAVLNHDDDVLWYQLHNCGAPVDEIIPSADCWDAHSGPAPQGGPEILCGFMGAPGGQARVRSVLRRSPGVTGYLFAVRRHEDLLNALGQPLFAVGLGYRYLSRGELPQGFEAGQLFLV